MPQIEYVFVAFYLTPGCYWRVKGGCPESWQWCTERMASLLLLAADAAPLEGLQVMRIDD